MIRINWMVIALLFAGTSAMAIDTIGQFDDPVLQARYDKITEEVRCLKCQNQSIRDSNAVLASDLRREIRRMLLEDMTDAEIYDFLVERYGEFALYRPRFQGKTMALWLLPFAFLLAGIVMIVRVVRRRMALPIDKDSE